MELVCPNLLIKRYRPFGGPHAEFFVQGGEATLVLAQCRSAVSGQVVQAHQPPVGTLAGPIVTQNACPAGQAGRRCDLNSIALVS